MDLPQGGLEVPCKLIFNGSPDNISKVAALLKIAPDHDKNSNSFQPAEKKPKLEASAVASITKQEPIEISPENSYSSDEGSHSTSIWLSLELNNKRIISLYCNDRNILCNKGKMLNDNHINYAQSLLKMQFPIIEGLESTLLQRRKTLKKIHHGIQIIHCHGNHWITVSTMDSIKGEINVYDSLYDAVDKDTLENRFVANTGTASAHLKLMLLWHRNNQTCMIAACLQLLMRQPLLLVRILI